MKKTNRSLLVIVLAAVALALVNLPQPSHAQVQLRIQQLTNTAIPTFYAQQGGTNAVALTNAQIIYNATNAVPFPLAGFQTVPVWWDVAAYATNAGTSNTVVGLDLSAYSDQSVWVSNALTATLAMTGTSTNATRVLYPVNNGTNVFSGYLWGRWAYASTLQSNNVTILKNELKAPR